MTVSIDQRAVTYWSDPSKHTWDELWLNHPVVRAKVNEIVTGRPDLWPIACLRSAVPERLPLARAASIGCGVGNLEKSLVELDLVGTVIGVDVTEATLRTATARMEALGFGDRAKFECADAREFLAGVSGLDAIFFHASLHHFERLPGLMKLVRDALKPGGILYLDEYVGPSRSEFRWSDVIRWNLIYWSLPRSVRRTKVIRKPINRDDPSEAIDSSSILPSVDLYFETIYRRDYGGNVLAPIYPSLLRPDQPGGPTPIVFDKAVRSLLARDCIVAHKSPSYNAVVIAQPRSDRFGRS